MKYILVTGANGNLGKAITTKFLEEGHRVTALISPRHPAGFMKHERLRIFQADLGREKETAQVISQALEGENTLDMGVLTVGGFGMGRLPDTPSEEVEKMVMLNFITAYHTVRPLFKHLAAQNNGGQIILIGARPVFDSGAAAQMVAYSLSKTLVIKLAEIINEEGKDKGITASVVVPSIIDTPQNREAMPEADVSGWVTPDEIAGNILHLLTPAGQQLKKVVLKVYGNS